MKRPLSALLALVLSLGSVPAQAQTAFGKIAVPAVSVPVAVPSALSVPSLGSPSLAPSIPSPPSGLAALAPAPHLSVVPSVVPIKAAVGPSAASFQAAAAPLEVLRSVSVSETPAALFDFSRTRSAAATDDLPREPAPDAAKTPKQGALQRYKASRGKNPLGNAFGNALFLTSMAAAAAPAAWGAVPAMKSLYLLAAADLMMAAVLVPVGLGIWAWRRLARGPQTAAKPPPTRRAKLAVVALGVVLGLGAGMTPYYATGPITEKAGVYLDSKKPVEDRSHARWIGGGAVEDETVKVLSKNAVGREILEKLRDRGGVLRLPPFFVSTQKDSHAEHENLFGGVYLNVENVTEQGWTVEQFLKDPELQRQLIRNMHSTVLHELVHEVQGRRPPWTKGYFVNTVECEQEAFFYQMLYQVARLESDPEARNNGHDQWLAIDAADDLDGFLRFVAAMYPDNKLVGEPYFEKLMAERRATWPAFRVRIYLALAARATGPGSAKMYMNKARAAAKEAGLPEPSPFEAAR